MALKPMIVAALRVIVIFSWKGPYFTDSLPQTFQ
jgi:hypothetical protein